MIIFHLPQMGRNKLRSYIEGWGRAKSMTIAPQFAKYSGVAATSALVDWLCYSVLIFFGTYYLTAQIFARLAGGIYAFFANKYWSFSRNDLPGIGVEAVAFCSSTYLATCL